MALARHIPPNLLIVSILLFGPPSCTLLPIPLFLFVLPSRFLVFCPFSFFSFVHVSHATVVVIQSVSSASLAYRSFAANLLFFLSIPPNPNPLYCYQLHIFTLPIFFSFLILINPFAFPSSSSTPLFPTFLTFQIFHCYLFASSSHFTSFSYLSSSSLKL